MKVNFDEFLNEYGGPGKTVGFRYSKPSIKYEFSIITVLNPELNKNKIKEDILKTLKDIKAEEDFVKFVHEKDDAYKLSIGMTAYSKFEVLSMAKSLFTKIKDQYDENIIFIIDSIELTGSDVESKTRPIGFRTEK